jgi:hypothetical protein
MALTAAPYGLVPVKQANDAPSTGVQREFPIASGAAGMFKGTPVRVSSGNLVPVSGATFGSSKADLYVGVFQGCSYVDASGNRQYADSWPNGLAVTGAVGYVAHDPETLFRVQASTANFNAVAAVGTSYGLLNFGSGNAVTGRSTAALDIASGAATTNPLKVVDIATLPDNTNGSGFVDVLVRINQGCHIFERA